jgi:hypothetical protein
MPEYKKNYYSGICLCGHSWENHHLSMVASLDYIKVTNEGTIPGECLRFGCNETGGLDENGDDHCFGYVDKGHPDKEELDRWQGTKR